MIPIHHDISGLSLSQTKLKGGKISYSRSFESLNENTSNKEYQSTSVKLMDISVPTE
jgi:hypothetical protein